MKSFNNKQEYLQAFALWKADYKKLSETIRAKKYEYKTAQRQRQNEYPLLISLRVFKTEATAMIEARVKSKVEAQRQYLAERNQ